MLACLKAGYQSGTETRTGTQSGKRNNITEYRVSIWPKLKKISIHPVPVQLALMYGQYTVIFNSMLISRPPMIPLVSAFVLDSKLCNFILHFWVYSNNFFITYVPWVLQRIS